jgi:predicted nucleotidyltransferase
MRRGDVTRTLDQHREVLRGRFGVTSIRLFGSVARDEASPDSDIDILVDFETPPTLFGFFRLRGYLEDLLNANVDLVTESGLKDRAREQVEKDAIRVA